MKKFILLLTLCYSFSFAQDEISIKFRFETDKGENQYNMSVGAHQDATFGLDNDLGEKELPPPPPGNLYSVINWIDSVDYNPEERISTKNNYYPIPENQNKYYYRYYFKHYKDNYDSLYIRWGKISEYIDSAFIIDPAEILFRHKLEHNGEYKIENTFIDNYFVDIYFSKEPTSVNENNDISIQIYPNPAINTLFINKRIAKAIIYDLSGKEIINTYDNIINVENLDSGIYFIKIMINEDEYLKKFIKR